MANQPVNIGNNGKATRATTTNKIWATPVVSLKSSSGNIFTTS